MSANSGRSDWSKMGAVRCNRLLGGRLSSNSHALAMNERERLDEIWRVVVRVDHQKPLVVPVLQSFEPAADGRFSKEINRVQWQLEAPIWATRQTDVVA